MNKISGTEILLIIDILTFLNEKYKSYNRFKINKISIRKSHLIA